MIKQASGKTLYTAIVLISFIVLIGLLVHLTYNTFVLNEQQYQKTEKLLMKEYYSKSIRNDKLYPGGQKILDYHLNVATLHSIDSLYKQESVHLQPTIDNIYRQLVHDLKENNTMDTVFDNIKELYQLDGEWEYALIINRISVTISDGKKIDIYKHPNDKLDLIDGIRIGGELLTIKATNLISNIIVSSPEDYSHEINFILYADRNDRKWVVFKLVAPIFLFGVACIAAIIVIYFITYKNWIRQKMLADMKSDFVNSITHEFHTPISTILIANKNLQNNPQINNHPVIVSITSIIERQSIRLQKLFSQVLDITSMGGYAIQKEEVNLRELLKNTVTDYKLNIKDKNTTIIFSTDDINIDIGLNPFFFTTMIVNLLENAVKHNLKDSKLIVVELRDKGKNIEISISDNGEGIADKDISNVFKKFHRSSQTKTNGLGLGLYYVKQCVQNHGWTMGVSSEERVGSRFILTIPKKQ